METKFQSSFIPKQPVNEPARSSSAGINIFFLISFLILVVSLIAGGGAYFWEKQLDTKIITVKSSLSKLRSSLDQTTIDEISRLNDKINTADLLLKQHVSPSVLFSVIGYVTLKSVRFTNFKYTNAGGDKISISMNGEAKSFESAAIQASAFTNPELRNVFRSPIFSDPDLTSTGQATFSFTTGIDKNLINYYTLKVKPDDKLFQSVGLSSKLISDNNAVVPASGTSTVDTSQTLDIISQ